MYDTVITWKENASKEWNFIVFLFLSGFIVYFVFVYACRDRTRGDKGEQYPGRRITAGASKSPNTVTLILSSIQYICCRKTSVSNMGAPSLLLAQGAIQRCFTPVCIFYAYMS